MRNFILVDWSYQEKPVTLYLLHAQCALVVNSYKEQLNGKLTRMLFCLLTVTVMTKTRDQHHLEVADDVISSNKYYRPAD